MNEQTNRTEGLRVSRAYVKKKDAAYKKISPEWSACPHCAGIFVHVCSNGCHLSDSQMKSFVSLFNKAKQP